MLRTKVHAELADVLTEVTVNSILGIRRKDEPIDLIMVEIMGMKHKPETNPGLIRGLVLDYGAQHPDMKKIVKEVCILRYNVVLLEYEKKKRGEFCLFFF